MEKGSNQEPDPSRQKLEDKVGKVETRCVFPFINRR